jgi:dipeptidyl-peptidase-4
MKRRCLACVAAFVILCAAKVIAQERLATLPGYANVERIRDGMQKLGADGRVSQVKWSDDGAAMTYRRQDKPFRINLTDFSVAAMEQPEDPQATDDRGGGPRRQPAAREHTGRAQQSTWVRSPNGQWIARCRDYNVVLEKVTEPQEGDGNSEQKAEQAANDQASAGADAKKTNQPEIIPVTTSGNQSFRYGTACWVYGEELFQDSAMWWSPDSRLLAFYEIDERHMQDYYLTIDNVETFTKLQVERYPKAGMPNPYVGLLIYNLESKQTVRVDVGGDRLQYVYEVRFTPDGKELLFSRTNRRQDTLEIMAADPATGRSRLVVAESQATWQNNKPLMRFLRDGQRFIWETERTGWKHFELRHLNGSLVNPLTEVALYPVESLVSVDEEAGWLYYAAYSGNNPLDAHLHRVRLDGTRHVRLTSKPLHHASFHIAPSHKWFVATYEAVDVPPTTALFNDRGEEVAVLATSDVTKSQELGLAAPELFTFKADDATTDLQGILHKPAHFDPSRKYPLVISVYGGPSSRGISDRYQPADPYCAFGFLIATIANRGTTDRGKAFETATYLKLGTVDIKDQVDGVKFLRQRPYVDATRVGIFGHSYGGYMSTMAVVRYPDVFHVAVAGAPVTDWRNYDTIYTERYMRTPQENPDGYRDGSCLTYAKNLQGRLLLMHGLADDNVHPSNTWQMVDAFQRENLRFDLMVFPRSKHGLGAGSGSLQWEYLHEHLRPEPIAVPAGSGA